MVTGILIIAFSLALLCYWFRYSCILLLRNMKETAPVVDDTRFRIGDVQAQLQSDTALDPLHDSLQRDYAMLVYLFEHAAGLQLSSVEDRLLVLDYRIMRCWYRFTRLVAPVKARQALSEMATVLSILAGRIERTVAHGRT
jgi:hypothetical protein